MDLKRIDNSTTGINLSGTGLRSNQKFMVDGIAESPIETGIRTGLIVVKSDDEQQQIEEEDGGN